MKGSSQVMVSRNLYTVGVMTLVTSVVWTLISIYNALTTTVETEIKAELLTPISATIDTKVVEQLATRRQYIEPLNLEEILVAKQGLQPTSTPTPSLSSETSEATPPAQTEPNSPQEESL